MANSATVRPLTREEVRGIDEVCIREYGLTGLVLMENAGREAASVLLRLGVQGAVAIVAGKGNNAGDGFVIARHLQLAGIETRIVLLTEPEFVRGDARVNLDVITRAELEIVNRADGNIADLCDGAEWIVDAMLGTGTVGPPRSPFDIAIKSINASNARVVAIDLPSGLDSDTGTAPGHAINADHTITFVAPKVGFANAAKYVGQVHTVPIGAPLCVLQSFLL